MAGWADRVMFSDDSDGGFAYVPNQIIVRNAIPEEELPRFLVGILGDVASPTIRDREDDRFLVDLPAGTDVPALVDDLRDAAPDLRAEPNVVLFAHAMSGNPLYGNSLYGNPLYGNPLYGNPLYGNPLYGNPLYGNPLYGNPLYGNPLYGNPLYGNPLYANPDDVNHYRKTGLRENSAHPAFAPVANTAAPSKAAEVFILDSGLAGQATSTSLDYIPDLLGPAKAKGLLTSEEWVLSGNPPTWTLETGLDEPDSSLKDQYLDPVAGHGTFIAGLIELLAPGQAITVNRLFGREGDVDVWRVCHDLGVIQGNWKNSARTLINLSFGGYSSKEMHFLPRKLRKLRKAGAVIVASAGNDGIARPSYPACLPGVISVAALGPNGPAPFTNYGLWVRACAPGTNVVSCFFNGFVGALPTEGTGAVIEDPDNFDGWARWSGTSFAAPAVVAALAREMVRTGCTAKEAVAAVIDGPGLVKILGLGTIVNIV